MHNSVRQLGGTDKYLGNVGLDQDVGGDAMRGWNKCGPDLACPAWLEAASPVYLLDPAWATFKSLFELLHIKKQKLGKGRENHPD